MDLKLATAVDGGLHLSLATLLFLEKAVSLILGLGDLAVEDLLGVILESHELGDLPVDEFLTLVLLCFKFLLFALLAHVLKFLALLVVFLDFQGMLLVG